jgi:hypothetical protein
LAAVVPRLQDADIRQRVVRAIVPVKDEIRDLHVSALDRDFHLLDVLVPSTPAALIATLGSADLIVCWPSTNHLSSAALALPRAPTRVNDATTKEAMKVWIHLRSFEAAAKG